MQVNSEIDIAWAAGLFEGEGNFSKRVASLTSTDEDIIRRFHKIVGVGTILRRENKSGKKPLWWWRVSNRGGILAVGNLFEPFLGERRLIQLAATRKHFDEKNANPKLSASMFRVWEERRKQGKWQGKTMGETCK